MRKIQIKYLGGIVVALVLANIEAVSQDTFLDITVDGGVCGFGFSSTFGSGSGTVNMRWDPSFSIIEAYAITHRYGRPPEYTNYVNDFPLSWNETNQYGSEVIDGSIGTQYYATHIQTIPFEIFNDQVVVFNLPPNEDATADFGFWAIYILLIYEMPDQNQLSRITIVPSDRRQDQGQTYVVSNYAFDDAFDVGLSYFTDRISDFYSDRSISGINGNVLGEIYTTDNEGSINISGAKGHFYYENGELFGLDDDVPNNTFNQSDVIAVVNEYMEPGEDAEVYINKAGDPAYSNVHPAFFLVSTPTCNPPSNDIEREYSICKGSSTELMAMDDYENYEWFPTAGLDDPFSQNPICSADSSTWYRVRIWNEDGCTQTIPIHVVVNDIPRPENLNIQPSSCPANTGFIGLNNPSGRGSFTYTVNGESQSNPEFNFLAPGVYNVGITSSTGCSWDSTLTIPLNPPQEAIFESRPESGYTPLETVFINQSTNAEFYTWLINGEEVSDSRNYGETFSEPGTYEISLIAYVDNENCADTTSFILIVNQGLGMIIPNIITPNGDGQNDQLVAQVFGAESLRWTIFDRWGKELFSGQTSTIEESLVLWEPTDDVKEGQYFLVVVGTGEDGRRQELKAAVTVLR